MIRGPHPSMELFRLQNMSTFVHVDGFVNDDYWYIILNFKYTNLVLLIFWNSQR